MPRNEPHFLGCPFRSDVSAVNAVLWSALIFSYFRDCDISYRVPSVGWAVRNSNPRSSMRCFSSPESPARVWGPPSPLFNGYRSSLRGVKRLGREADHSPPSGTKVKYEWSYSSDPLHAFTEWTEPALLFFFAFTVNFYQLSDLKRCDRYEGHRNGPAEWQPVGLAGRILICVASCLGGRSAKPFRYQGY
jgi:hypothetical protein